MNKSRCFDSFVRIRVKKSASDFSPIPFSLNVNYEIFARFHPLDDVFRICLVAFHLLFADIADEGFKNIE